MAQLLGARLDGKDERSRAFQAPLATEIHTVQHRHYGPILSQWVGSCTGHSSAQALNTQPFHKPRTFYKNDDDAMNIYKLATTLDPWPGSYPPEDTGSSVLAAGKAARQLGFLTTYRWAFGYDQMLAALMLSPVVVGTNWYEGMFHPSTLGFLEPTGKVAGGHAYLIIGYSRMFRYFTMLNSWGIGWGRKGKARISDDTMWRLLREDGEAVVYSTA